MVSRTAGVVDGIGGGTADRCNFGFLARSSAGFDLNVQCSTRAGVSADGGFSLLVDDGRAPASQPSVRMSGSTGAVLSSNVYWMGTRSAGSGSVSTYMSAAGEYEVGFKDYWEPAAGHPFWAFATASHLSGSSYCKLDGFGGLGAPGTCSSVYAGIGGTVAGVLCFSGAGIPANPPAILVNMRADPAPICPN